MTCGGSAATALKKEYGARLSMPAAERVDTQALPVWKQPVADHGASVSPPMFASSFVDAFTRVPYWVVPLIGPSGPRDFVGYAGDRWLNLLPWQGLPIAIVNDRAIAVPTIDRARESSLDYYVFVRDAYLQARETFVNDGQVIDNFSDFEEGEDFEDF